MLTLISLRLILWLSGLSLIHSFILFLYMHAHTSHTHMGTDRYKDKDTDINTETQRHSDRSLKRGRGKLLIYVL